MKSKLEEIAELQAIFTKIKIARTNKDRLQQQINDLEAEVAKKREQVAKLNTQVHDLNQRLFNVRDSIRRLAYDAEKK